MSKKLVQSNVTVKVSKPQGEARTPSNIRVKSGMKAGQGPQVIPYD